MPDLTEFEVELLKEAETKLAACTSALCQMADNLRAIRDQRLYRKSHETFESYCEERWELTVKDLQVVLQYNS